MSCHAGSSRETQITEVCWDLAQHIQILIRIILYSKRKNRSLDLMKKYQAPRLLKSQGQAKHVYERVYCIPYCAPAQGFLFFQKPPGNCSCPANALTYCRRRQSSCRAHKKYAGINSLGHCCLSQRQTHTWFCFSTHGSAFPQGPGCTSWVM